MISENIRNGILCQRVKSRGGGGNKVGGVPVTAPKGTWPQACTEREKETRERREHGSEAAWKSRKITSGEVRSEQEKMRMRSWNTVRCIRGLRV